MSKQIENLRSKLAAIGGSLDDTAYDLHCDAPRGYVWCGNGLPTISIPYASNSQSWLSAALRAEKASLELGLRLATEEELPEIRWNNDDDTWGAPEGSPETINFKL